MGWPDSGYLWREGAKPAQEQYANIAIAISEFEPLTMFANKGPVRRRFQALPSAHPGLISYIPTNQPCLPQAVHDSAA